MPIILRWEKKQFQFCSIQVNAKAALDFKITCILLHIILKTAESGNHHCGCTVHISHKHSCLQNTTLLNEVHTTLQIQRRKKERDAKREKPLTT